jgi:hypothetical protein
MSLAAKLNQLLQPLESQSLGPDRPHTLHCAVERGSLRIELTSVGPLACAIQSLELENPDTEAWNANQLKAWSERLAERVRYLLEPISAVELDEEAAVLQMRSHPPAHDERVGRTYYELTAQPGHLRLQRYQKTAGQPRTAVAMHFTREVLSRLAGDLVASV